MASKPKTEGPYSVDTLMQNLALTLVSSFQEDLRDPCFCSDLQTDLRSGDIARIRKSNPVIVETSDIYRFKASYQMASLFKRHRFEHDTYTDQELIEKAVTAFKTTQDRIASVSFDNCSSNLDSILDKAAMYIRKVLGEYSDEEHRSLCRFGKKASVGIPARKACEAERWEVPISGSRNQIAWFHSEMNGIDCVMNYLRNQLHSDPQGSMYREVDSLTLTLVPKTFKSLRAIMPNTTIGSYMSYGLGEMIRKRLKRNGYDIRKLQMQHRIIACRASSHMKYVTADLSSASDSITRALVERLFPPDWFEILDRSRISKVVLPDGSSMESKTFCTMGIGYTFPLQTLVFLSLLIAIQATLFNRSEWKRISVYGDDLIYSVDIHNEVLRIFPACGFVVNVDKTFSTGNFRESCGGDYYRGVDVRPFQPRNGSTFVLKREYEAVLYKCINGLLMRWSEHEVERALAYLVREIERVTGCCKLVPREYPDDSGIKCVIQHLPKFLVNAKVTKPKHLGHGVYRFTFLRFVPQLRKEIRHEPYLWLSLMGGNSVLVDYSSGPPMSVGFYKGLIESHCGVSTIHTSVLQWKEDSAASSVRSRLTGRRLRRLASFVVENHSGRYTRQSGVSNF